jgi:predicted RNA binding protein YcfA (HicA-like mRNA interferase family)
MLARINGSHHVYMKQGNPSRISLPIHKNEALKAGLLRHFMKIAGIREDEL